MPAIWPGVNAGHSCIAPQRVFVEAPLADQLRSRLAGVAIEIIPVGDQDEAIRRSQAIRHRLGTSIFGSPRSAEAVAGSLDVGCIVINDVIVPTADPRVPFGGRGDAGFGVTRGPEGLLEMTVPKVILRRRHGPRLHRAGCVPDGQPPRGATHRDTRQVAAAAAGGMATTDAARPTAPGPDAKM